MVQSASVMRKLLYVIVIIALLIGLFLYFMDTKKQELNAFIQPAYTDMAKSGWSIESVKRYASPQLLAFMAEHDISGALAVFKANGGIKSFGDIEKIEYGCEKKMAQEKVCHATIDHIIEFDTGKRTVTTKLITSKDKWRLMSFRLHARK